MQLCFFQGVSGKTDDPSGGFLLWLEPCHCALHVALGDGEGAPAGVRHRTSPGNGLAAPPRRTLEGALYLADRIIVVTECPSTVLKEIKIDLPRPRDVADKAFVDVRNEVTELIKWW